MRVVLCAASALSTQEVSGLFLARTRPKWPPPADAGNWPLVTAEVGALGRIEVRVDDDEAARAAARQPAADEQGERQRLGDVDRKVDPPRLKGRRDRRRVRLEPAAIAEQLRIATM